MASLNSVNQGAKSSLSDDRFNASRVYRPRVHCDLTVPAAGKTSEKRALENSIETITLPVRVRKLHLTRNDHNQADECKIEAEYLDVGLDPRTLGNATVAVYVGEDDFQKHGVQTFTPTKDNLRFVGIVTRCTREGSENDGHALSIDFQDYTSLFLQYKHYPPEAAIPYEATLEEAWNIVCDNTGPWIESEKKIKSVVSVLKNKLRAQGGVSLDKKIGEAVTERFRSLGKVIPKNKDMDCWAYWQQCVQMLGLISYIYLDECVVTTATNLYTVTDPPIFVWGNNIEYIKEEKNLLIGKRPILVRSYDPLTNKQLEAFYPPVDDPRSFKKTTPAKTKEKQQGTAITKGQDRYVVHYPAVTSQEALDEIALRIYLEMAAQELEGTLGTKEMSVLRAHQGLYDLLNLGAGDSIQVTYDPESKSILKGLKGDKRSQINYLTERGYSLSAANYLVDNLNEVDKWLPNFYVRRVEVMLDSDETDCDFRFEIGYVNMINIDGSTQDNSIQAEKDLAILEKSLGA